MGLVDDPGALGGLENEEGVAVVEEIGDAIVFLASDYASYMTGEALSVSCRHA